MKNKRVVIIGATSAIAHEVARIFALEQSQLYLIGRNESRLIANANDLQVRGGNQVEYYAADLADTSKHEEIINQAINKLGGIDIVLIAYGSLSDQRACEVSYQQTLSELNVNFLSVVSFLTLFANYFEKQKQGCLAVISSVAGDRGRQSNYIYGTAKGALSIFMQGLRNRLSKAGVNVLTIKPGFVDTPMTRDYKKGLLWSNPQKVAKDIVKAIKKNKHVVYVPYYWRYIMLIITAIPERIFKRLSL